MSSERVSIPPPPLDFEPIKEQRAETASEREVILNMIETVSREAESYQQGAGTDGTRGCGTTTIKA